MSSARRRWAADLAALLGCGLAVLGGWVPGAAGQLNAALPFTDSFSTSDGSELSAFWTDQRGDITVVNGQATGTGHGKTNLSTVNGISQADVTVAASVALDDGQDVGLVTRYSGPLESNFYLGQLAGTAAGFQATIWKNVGGAQTKLTKGLTAGSGSGTLEFQTIGSTMTLLLDGNVLATATDTDLVSGSAGMRLGQDATVSSFQAL